MISSGWQHKVKFSIEAPPQQDVLHGTAASLVSLHEANLVHWGCALRRLGTLETPVCWLRGLREGGGGGGAGRQVEEHHQQEDQQ